MIEQFIAVNILFYKDFKIESDGKVVRKGEKYESKV